MPYILIIIAAATRLIPHANNAAAITAVAIFSGAMLPKKQAFIVPLAARFVTDIFLGFFAWQLMVAVYGAHVLGVFLGTWIKQPATAVSTSRSDQKMTQIGWLKVTGVSLASSLFFFLITNFAFLYPSYPHTWAGIVLAYVNGAPFFRGTVIGDVGYTLGIFGLFAAAQFTASHAHQTTSA